MLKNVTDELKNSYSAVGSKTLMAVSTSVYEYTF